MKSAISIASACVAALIVSGSLIFGFWEHQSSHRFWSEIVEARVQIDGMNRRLSELTNDVAVLKAEPIAAEAQLKELQEKLADKESELRDIRMQLVRSNARLGISGPNTAHRP